MQQASNLTSARIYTHLFTEGEDVRFFHLCLDTRLKRAPGLTAATLLALLLQACGGGGGDSGGASPTDPAAEAAAGKAHLQASYNPDTRRAELRWDDPYADETGFRIEKLGADNIWTLIETLAASADTGKTLRWVTPLDGIATFRVMAVLPARQIALKTSSLAVQLPVGLAGPPPTLGLSTAEPLKGALGLSITGAPAARSVAYAVDQTALTGAATAPSFRIEWDSRTVSNGPHALLAIIETSADSFVEVRRTAIVGNADLQLSLGTRTEANVTLVDVSARPGSSGRAIASVELWVDGRSAGMLTATNACDPRGCIPAWAFYRFELQNALLVRGEHGLRVVAIDAAGDSAELKQTAFFNSAPAVRLDSPVDRQIVTGKLDVKGLVTDDAAVDVVVKLGDVTIKSTGAGSLDFRHDLSGLPGGSYELSVLATDAQGASSSSKVTVLVHTGSLSFEAVPGAGDARTLLDLGGDSLLVADGGGAVSLLRPDSTQPGVLLQGARNDPQFPPGMRVSGGWSAALMKTPDGLESHTYAWNGSGVRSDLVALSAYPLGSGRSGYPALNGPWVAWSSDGPKGPDLLRNLETGEQHVIPVPAGMQYTEGNTSIAVVPGGARLYYFAASGAAGTSSLKQVVFVYDTQTRSATRLTPLDRSVGAFMLDGTQYAWTYPKPNGSEELLRASAAQPSVTRTVSTTSANAQFKGGLLAWVQAPGPPTLPDLAVDREGQAVQMLHAGNSTLLEVGSGALVYNGPDGKAYLWTPSGGSQLLTPWPSRGRVRLSQGWLYLDGYDRLYRIPLSAFR